MGGRRGRFCAVRAHRCGSFVHASRGDRARQDAGHTHETSGRTRLGIGFAHQADRGQQQDVGCAHEASGGRRPRAANPHRANEQVEPTISTNRKLRLRLVLFPVQLDVVVIGYGAHALLGGHGFALVFHHQLPALVIGARLDGDDPAVGPALRLALIQNL